MSMPLTDTPAFWNRLKENVREVMGEMALVPLQPNLEEVAPLLKVKEVCALFAISRPTLYQWMHNGQLPSIKVGARRYFKRAHIQAMLEQGEAAAFLLPLEEEPANRS